MHKSAPEHSAATFILFPAVTMLLGWGLRGYIGGGPFGAMIPGAFVALCLSLLFNHDARTAGFLALFGAIGIGYGGDMTYGQTLHLATHAPNIAWGFLGVTVKGAVWGLLGGAILGVGLTRERYSYRTLMTAFILTIVAFYAGWKLINEPQLIYFSDPHNKPREESWAGLLFAAIVFIGYLRSRTSGDYRDIPLRFALWGALGGGLGFGGGTLWMLLGPHLPVTQKWFGWWKAMEFTFGFLLGAFLGLAAYRDRKLLTQDPEQVPVSAKDSCIPVVVAAMFVAFIFICQEPITAALSARVEQGARLAPLYRDIIRVLGCFIFFGAVCFAIGLRSLHAAWQIAITLTFFHTVFDLLGDMTPDKHNMGFILPGSARLAILLSTTACVGLCVARLQQSQRPIHDMLMLIVWACYAVATVRTFGHKDIWLPEAGAPNGLGVMLGKGPSIFVVFAIFTVSALISTWYIRGYFRKTPAS